MAHKIEFMHGTDTTTPLWPYQHEYLCNLYVCILHLPLLWPLFIVSCDPSCSSGVCVQENICFCPEGYTGDTCQTALTEDCGGVDPNCQLDEICFKQAGSFFCVDCATNPANSLCPTTGTYVSIAMHVRRSFVSCVVVSKGGEGNVILSLSHLVSPVPAKAILL